jgi:hypothetical protein
MVDDRPSYDMSTNGDRRSSRDRAAAVRMTSANAAATSGSRQ